MPVKLAGVEVQVRVEVEVEVQVDVQVQPPPSPRCAAGGRLAGAGVLGHHQTSLPISAIFKGSSWILKLLVLS